MYWFARHNVLCIVTKHKWFCPTVTVLFLVLKGSCHEMWILLQEVSYCKFNVFRVRALYYTKTQITNKMHKESFIINCNTLLRVSTLLGHLQGECFVIVTLRLHFIVEWECAVDCVLEAWTLRSRPALPRPGPQRVHASKNNAVHS
jgi:hypothetical protein